MYHYRKNIGDYRSATMHLSLLEHGVYNQLLDWYYLEEQPLPLDNRTLFRRLSAKTDADMEAIRVVLSEMFTRTEKGYVHKRVEREIAQYRARVNQAREAGKLGGRPRKTATVSGKTATVSEETETVSKKKRTLSQPITANQEPLTANQERKSRACASACGSRLPADWTAPADWIDWARTERPDIDPKAEAAAFADYWHSVAGARARKADWLATWRNWIRRASPPRVNGPKPPVNADFRGKTYAGTPIDELPPDLRAAAKAAMRDS